MSIITLKKDEGFKGMPYVDTKGFLTVGYGTKLPLTEYEATMLLEYRFEKIKRELEAELSFLNIEQEAWDILYLMAYQLGVNGVLNFKKMIEALQKQDYVEASIQMRDSRWYNQTQNRAERMAQMMEKV